MKMPHKTPLGMLEYPPLHSSSRLPAFAVRFQNFSVSGFQHFF
jgi:hypothetical protein